MALTNLIPRPGDNSDQMPDLSAFAAPPPQVLSPLANIRQNALPNAAPGGALPPLPELPRTNAALQAGTLQPLVTNPRQQQEQSLQADINHMTMPQPQQPGFWHKLGHVAARIGNIAGDVLAPSTMMLIPGTDLGNKFQAGLEQRQLRGLQQQDIQEQQAAQERQLQQAQTEEAQAKAAAAGLVTITPEQAHALGSPELEGQQVTQGVLQHLYTTTKNVEGRKDVAQIQSDMREEVAKLKPEQRDDKAIRLLATPPAQLTDDDKSYLQGYQKWIDATKTAPGVARAAAYGQVRAQWQPIQIANPDGSTSYVSAAQAIGGHMAGTQSIPFRTALGVARYMTSGKGGQTLSAYRTAYDHLDLLQRASDALENGDVQTVNSLKNSFREAFGSAAPTNFNSVKSMLAGELANVAKVTGATDSEIKSMKDQLNRSDSMAQIRGVIQTNQDLMDQKAYEMYLQNQSGMQGQPFFGGGVNRVIEQRGGTAPTADSGELKAGSTQSYGGKTYRFKGGDRYNQANWVEVKR